MLHHIDKDRYSWNTDSWILHYKYLDFAQIFGPEFHHFLKKLFIFIYIFIYFSISISIYLFLFQGLILWDYMAMDMWGPYFAEYTYNLPVH